MKPSPIKTSYDGLICTEQYLSVHFKVGNGSWIRHSTVKVPLRELLTDEVTQMIDRHVRRRMIEIWSDTPLPDLFSEPPWSQ